MRAGNAGFAGQIAPVERFELLTGSLPKAPGTRLNRAVGIVAVSGICTGVTLLLAEIRDWHAHIRRACKAIQYRVPGKKH